MYEAWGKRALDVALAAILLLPALPLMALLALAVRVALGRPVLFRQTRAGLGGQPFTLVKFRSLTDGPGPDAARMTGFGRRLRASGLDELPQLLLVLTGQMSLVGPRPLPMAYVPHYSPRQARRLLVRPGLLGPGVAAGRNAVPWDRRLALEAAYATAPRRIGTDLRLILGSLRVWLSGRGATAPGHASMPAFTRE